MKCRNPNNFYVHNRDPIKERRREKTIKNLIYGGLAFLLIGSIGKGCYDSDIEFTKKAAKYYSDNYLQKAKTEMAAGNTQKAKQIARRGYNELKRELSEHVVDAFFISGDCVAISDSLYGLSQ